MFLLFVEKIIFSILKFIIFSNGPYYLLALKSVLLPSFSIFWVRLTVLFRFLCVSRLIFSISSWKRFSNPYHLESRKL